MSAKLLEERNKAYGTLDEEEEMEHGLVLYRASFGELEDTYIRYRTWALFGISLVMILAYGLGLLMLVWLPVLRYIAREDLRSRRLYITSENVVYKNAPPACCPCFGVNKTEKHILLPLITDVVLSQSWFEAWFGIWTVSIENAGQGGGGGANNRVTPDLKIQGIYQPEIFKKLLLRAATAKRAGMQFTQDDVEGIVNSHHSHSPSPLPPVAAYSTVPLGYPPHYAASAPSVASTEQVQAMNDTLIRMEHLLERQTQLFTTVLQSQSQSQQVPAYAAFSPTTSSQTLLPL